MKKKNSKSGQPQKKNQLPCARPDKSESQPLAKIAHHHGELVHGNNPQLLPGH